MRDSRAGAVTERFRYAFEARRNRGMRADVDADGWRGLYRLGLNTVGAGTTEVLTVGCPISVPGL